MKKRDFEIILKETLQGKESLIYNDKEGFTLIGCTFLACVGLALLGGLFYVKK